MINEKVSVLIAAYKEPRTIGKAIESFLCQLKQLQKSNKIKWEILLIAPDRETLKVMRLYSKKDKKIKVYKDPRKGKPVALNILFKKAKGDILILSDGDVYVSSNAIRELLKQFKNKKIGAVTGRPVSISPKDKMLGYWSHLLTDIGAHKTRLIRTKQGKFILVSGYLFAMRKLFHRIPEDALSDDAVMAHMVWQQGYKIGYSPKARVYVKYPTTFADWILQKRRSTGGYIQIDKYFKNPPRMRTFWRELLYGSIWVWSYPKTIKQMFYTLMLFPAKLYLWFKIKKEVKKDQTRMLLEIWRPIESTK